MDSYQIALTGIAVLITAVLLVMLTELISKKAPVPAPAKIRDAAED